MTNLIKPKYPKRLKAAIEELSKPMPGKLKFDIRTWGTHHATDHKPTEHNFCGTTACAWGTIALSPRIKRMGVKTKWAFNDFVGAPTMQITFKRKAAEDAAAKFFGIPVSVADWLFIPIEYALHGSEIRKHHVLRRMKAVLKGISKDDGGNPVLPHDFGC